MARSLLAIRLRPLPAFAIVLLLLVTTAAGSLDCYRLAAVQAKMRDAGDPVSFPTQSVGQLTQHIVELERVVARRPDDAEGQMRLAQLWLALQPARNLALVEWEKLPADKRKEVAEQVWQESSPRALHERATMLERESRTYELLQLRNSPFVLTDVAQAARHILLARNACPVMPLPHLALAQLSPLLPSLGRDVYHLEHLRRVAHLDLPMLSESSVLELQSRRSDQLLQDWRVLGRYKPERLPQMVTFLIEQLQLGEKIELVLPDDPLPLAHLARAELAESVRQPVREAVVSKLKKLITSDETPDNLFLQAVLASLQNNRAAAVANMTQAIALHPRDAEWRYQFALMLEADGQLAEARKQASMCARLVPEDPRYEALLKHLIESELTVP